MHKQVTVTRGLLAYLTGAILVSCLAMSIGGVLYSVHRDKESDRRWCQLFHDLDQPVDPGIKDPVQRKRSEAFVKRIHDLRVEYECVSR